MNDVVEVRCDLSIIFNFYCVRVMHPVLLFAPALQQVRACGPFDFALTCLENFQVGLEL